eukprot:TRINITY_DN4900_c0_g1_i2.p1 TRINITY_DN4900_c0_g1~~TRINITY_DN4900_c0_g1_i2.p1  ORF type:complete len:486 (+),score=102.35 TRINITY_DN4900_c0_g1_i2:1136-2593(+)
MDAVAVIRGQEGESVTGTVTFSQTSMTGRVLVSVNIQGLGTRTSVAIHVHEFGDLTSVLGSNTGASSGGHFIGAGSRDHGCPDGPRHEGDMGSWAVIDGAVSQSKLLDLLTLEGANSILGRAVVVHTTLDSCKGAAGDAGIRIGFGVIGSTFSTESNIVNNEAKSITKLVSVLQGTSACTTCAGTMYISQSSPGSPIKFLAIFENTGEEVPHGIHIHTFGDLTLPNAANAGGHWNPTSASHNLPPALDRHYGDIGMVQTYYKGKAYYEYTDNLITDINALIGRSIILHKNRDHGNGQGCDASGNSGPRIAMGAIGIQNPATEVPTIPSGVVIDNNWVSEDCTPRQTKTNTWKVTFTLERVTCNDAVLESFHEALQEIIQKKVDRIQATSTVHVGCGGVKHTVEAEIIVEAPEKNANEAVLRIGEALEVSSPDMEELKEVTGYKITAITGVSSVFDTVTIISCFILVLFFLKRGYTYVVAPELKRD